MTHARDTQADSDPADSRVDGDDGDDLRSDCNTHSKNQQTCLCFSVLAAHISEREREDRVSRRHVVER